MKLVHKFVTLGTLALALAGCQASGTTYGPIEKLPNGSFILTLDYKAQANTTNKVFFTALMKPDCSFLMDVPISVVQQPAHGTLTIRKAHDVLKAPPYDALQPACYRKPAAGTLVEYTPTPGYQGPDQFSYQMPTVENRDSTTFMPGVFVRYVEKVSVQ